MRLLWILLPLLAQDAFGQDMFSVRPEENQVVRVGEDVTLKCETKVDALCAWKLATSTDGEKGFIFSSPFQISEDLSAITPLAPGSKRNCSFKISNIDDSYNGNYTCAPYIGGGQKSAGNVAEIIVARKPESLRFLGAPADGYPLKVSTSDPTSVQCEAVNARPKAEIFWYLDTIQIYETVTVIDTPANDPSLWNTVSTLTYQFRKEDFGKTLRCRASHHAYDEQDEYQREHGVEVDVQFAAYRPEGDIGRMYGFTAGEEGEIVVNFTANPRPSVMSWRVGDEVKVAAGGETRDGRFKSSLIIERNVARGMYALKLTIDPVQIEDQSKTFALQLENEIGETELKFQIGTGSAPLPEGNAAAADGTPPGLLSADGRMSGETNAVDGGTIGAIVAAVLVLLIIIGVVAFGRSRGKWCFAAKSTEARSDRSDTESAHDEKTDKPEKKPVKISTLFSSLLKGNKTDADVEAAENKEETRELTKPDGEADGEAPPQPKKENEVVYAELLLDRDGVKTDVRPSAEKTEYAVIVGTKTEADAAAEDNKMKE